MTTVVRLLNRLVDLADMASLLQEPNDGKVLTYDHGSRSFVLQEMTPAPDLTDLAARLTALETVVPDGLMFVLDNGDVDNGDVEFIIG